MGAKTIRLSLNSAEGSFLAERPTKTPNKVFPPSSVAQALYGMPSFPVEFLGAALAAETSCLEPGTTAFFKGVKSGRKGLRDSRAGSKEEGSG